MKMPYFTRATSQSPCLQIVQIVQKLHNNTNNALLLLQNTQINAIIKETRKPRRVFEFPENVQ
ncbi:hypothetical protein COPEUT_01851 [Coprococcus eutactus ATCC 27759]|nr:hypothetical protein COPEUT_01851 [Coprococcus eutactus ATCC 27759]